MILRQILETSIGTSIVRKKDNQSTPLLKKRGGAGITASEIEQTEEFIGQFTDVFNKNDHSEVPFLSRSAPFMDDIVVSNEGVTKRLKGLNPSKALGPDELHPRVLKELATELGPGFAISLFKREKSPKNGLLHIYAPLLKG